MNMQISNIIQFYHVGFELGERYHYQECGLDNVFLLSGYEHQDFDGEIYTSIHDVNDLHERILESLALKKELLTAKEIRFIRREMDLTQVGLANIIGSSGQAVARWERLNSKPTDIPLPNDLLLKILIQDHVKGIRPFDLLKALSEMDEGGLLTVPNNDNDDHWNIEMISTRPASHSRHRKL